MSDPYVYPGTEVLRNKLDIRDKADLDRVERRIVSDRASADIPKGKFDLDHLRAIHRHLFSPLYDWAGEVRIVEISKGGSQFQFTKYIETGMADIHRRLKAERFLKNKSPKVFAQKAAEILGDINYVHPFREGNGRTQILYAQQLAQQAGYELDLTKIDPAQWLNASKEAHQARYDDMASCLETALSRDLSRDGGR
jgi:cell filamentation protein